MFLLICADEIVDVAARRHRLHIAMLAILLQSLNGSWMKLTNFKRHNNLAEGTTFKRTDADQKDQADLPLIPATSRFDTVPVALSRHSLTRTSIACRAVLHLHRAVMRGLSLIQRCVWFVRNKQMIGRSICLVNHQSVSCANA